MLPETNDAAYLADILNAIRLILEYTKGKTEAEYRAESMLRDAVERRLEIVGEAARRLSENFCIAHPEIPWRKIKGSRNIIAHDYDGVDHAIVWRIVQEHLPILKSQLEQLLPPEPKNTE
jgi:uncharacterized protein with HEPN domain